MLLTPQQTEWLEKHFKHRVNVIRSLAEEKLGLVNAKKKRAMRNFMWKIKERQARNALAQDVI